MSIDLSGKRFIVTGAARGVGRAIAERCARSGADVVLFDILPEVKDVAAAIAAEHGIEASGATADATDRPTMVDAVGQAAQQGRIDGLVNNAGMIPPARSFEEIDGAAWERMLRVNATSQLYGAQAVVPFLRRGGGGSIVNVVSRQFFTAPPGQADYIASKGAAIGLTRALARELGPDRITVNGAAPGMLLTPGVLDALPGAAERAAGAVATQSIAVQEEPEDFAGPVAFLLSDAARFITGQILIVDGGGYLH